MSVLQKNGVRSNGAGRLGAQGAVGERSGGTVGVQAALPPDPELIERPQRRRHQGLDGKTPDAPY